MKRSVTVPAFLKTMGTTKYSWRVAHRLVAATTISCFDADLLEHCGTINIGFQYRSRILMNELLTRMFFGGFVRMHVLYHAVREPVFGVEMMAELARHGYDVGAGTLPDAPPARGGGIPDRCRPRSWPESSKYYEATPKGAVPWTRPRTKLRELVKEVLTMTAHALDPPQDSHE